MAVLGIQKTVEFYSGDPKVANMQPFSNPKKSDLEIETNAIAIYQVADDLYMHEKYRLDTGAKTNAPEGPKTNSVAAR
jgi:hypothetical protein